MRVVRGNCNVTMWQKWMCSSPYRHGIIGRKCDCYCYYGKRFNGKGCGGFGSVVRMHPVAWTSVVTRADLQGSQTTSPFLIFI